MSIRVAVEGNIGAGKTTMLRCLKEELERRCAMPVVVSEENVARWIQDDLLAPMYQGGGSAACAAFQALGPMTDFLERLAAERDRAPCVSVQERHLLTVTHVFAKAATDPAYGGVTSSAEHARAFRGLAAAADAAVGGALLRPVHVLLYLRTPAAVCHDRMRARNRGGETAALTRASLGCLEGHHDAFYEGYEPLWSKHVLAGDRADAPTLAREAADLLAGELGKVH